MTTAIQPVTNLFDLDRAGLEAFFIGLGEKKFRAQQVMKWMYHQQVIDFEQMTDLGKSLRDKLNTHAELRLPKILHEQQSSDGTCKWVLELEGGNAVETVFIPEANRGTLCVSSQIGCGLNCSFCSTGTQGFNRDLTTAEVIGQVWIAANSLGSKHRGARRITNVVMMGMGEPLLNFDNVVPAMSLMRDDYGFGLASRRVTLSTAGLVPMIDRLNAESDVALAVSLHAPDDELRTQLVPLNKKYPIAELMAACQRYAARKAKTQITFEYTLMKGINDKPEQARALVKLLRRVPSKLNLIPFNPFPGTKYERSEPMVIATFQKIVMDGGLIATVRRTRGDDIDAACGQLVGKVMDRTRRQADFRRRIEAEVHVIP
ncbi:23S rRNA (adenine(2503)-C(2))-methyltransferase RlmN [Pseudolysobacter antarcticus]|uniref:23S rRNA (adenine(2503)-C(2))-methyltransferase RlmN n=1 Tax=Pseudolysobacter antarcticus TaxID=2511995 RepID=UPI001F5CA199|nr:23S rRNA (adenine(2503)-C(2))-methyltransferase RlmN [Pseudolysobacter antarcticus]